jgi:WD40 repeat protein
MGYVIAVLYGHSSSVRSVVFSQDGARLASGSYDNTVRLWDGVTGDAIAVLDGHSSSVSSVVFSQDGARLASGSFNNDKAVRLWDGVTGDAIAVLNGHSSSVRSVVFSQDGARLASGSNDNTVRLWDGVTGDPIAVLEGHASTVRFVVFSQDGARLVSGSDDMTVRLWNLDIGPQQFGTEPLSQEEHPHVYSRHDMQQNATFYSYSSSRFTFCVPSDLSISTQHAIHNSYLAFGCNNGQVIVLYFPSTSI